MSDLAPLVLSVVRDKVVSDLLEELRQAKSEIRTLRASHVAQTELLDQVRSIHDGQIRAQRTQEALAEEVRNLREAQRELEAERARIVELAETTGRRRQREEEEEDAGGTEEERQRLCPRCRDVLPAAADDGSS